MGIFLSLLGNKYTYVALLLVVCGIYVAALKVELRHSAGKISEQYVEIGKLRSDIAEYASKVTLQNKAVESWKAASAYQQEQSSLAEAKSRAISAELHKSVLAVLDSQVPAVSVEVPQPQCQADEGAIQWLRSESHSLSSSWQ